MSIIYINGYLSFNVIVLHIFSFINSNKCEQLQNIEYNLAALILKEWSLCRWHWNVCSTLYIAITVKMWYNDTTTATNTTITTTNTTTTTTFTTTITTTTTNKNNNEDNINNNEDNNNK